MQNAYKHQENHQNMDADDNMKIHAILSKFHIEHTQNGATICSKQQLGILKASKQ